MTTSLASYLINAGFAEQLVVGLKEPAVFSADRPRAREIVAHRSMQSPGRWLLDGSVDYVQSDEAVDAIVETVKDHRIFVCLRNQLERTASAYLMYMRFGTRKSDEAAITGWPASLRFGDVGLRRSARTDAHAPSGLLDPVLGRYIFTSIVSKQWRLQPGDGRIGDVDAEVERFSHMSLPARVADELRHFRRSGRFPLISVLSLSYFAPLMKRLLTRVEPHRISVCTLGERSAQSALEGRLQEMLQIQGHRHGMEFPRDHARESNGLVCAREVDLIRDVLDSSFGEDTRQVIDLLQAYPQVDTSLFRASALYGGSSA